jgi:ABC-type multidrug transport system ATPase subunit
MHLEVSHLYKEFRLFRNSRGLSAKVAPTASWRPKSSVNSTRIPEEPEFPTPQGPLQALKDINLHVNHGELVCVVGASGSGKSSLLRLIAALDMPTSGTIKVDGDLVTGPGAERGMIFQNYTLYPWMTVAANVEFGLKLQGYSKAQRHEPPAPPPILGEGRFAKRVRN